MPGSERSAPPEPLLTGYDPEAIRAAAETGAVREPMAAAAGGGAVLAREALLRAFLRRYSAALLRIGGAAPERALENALAAPDDVGGLAAILSEVAPLAPPPATDPLAAARARGARAKGELLRRAGGGLRLAQAAARMGVSPQAVHARRKRGTLLAVPQPNGEHLYPACQFGPDGVLTGLTAVLQAFTIDNPWTRLSVLLGGSPALEGRTPLEALSAGDVERAAAAVAGFGEHLA